MNKVYDQLLSVTAKLCSVLLTLRFNGGVEIIFSISQDEIPPSSGFVNKSAGNSAILLKNIYIYIFLCAAVEFKSREFDIYCQ